MAIFFAVVFTIASVLGFFDTRIKDRTGRVVLSLLSILIVVSAPLVTLLTAYPQYSLLKSLFWTVLCFFLTLIAGAAGLTIGMLTGKAKTLDPVDYLEAKEENDLSLVEGKSPLRSKSGTPEKVWYIPDSNEEYVNLIFQGVQHGPLLLHFNDLDEERGVSTSVYLRDGEGIYWRLRFFVKDIEVVCPTCS